MKIKTTIKKFKSGTYFVNIPKKIIDSLDLNEEDSIFIELV